MEAEAGTMQLGAKEHQELLEAARGKADFIQEPFCCLKPHAYGN
jgi:hypothetical protein